jgi:hypothetical protein
MKVKLFIFLMQSRRCRVQKNLRIFSKPAAQFCFAKLCAGSAGNAYCKKIANYSKGIFAENLQ